MIASLDRIIVFMRMVHPQTIIPIFKTSGAKRALIMHVRVDSIRFERVHPRCSLLIVLGIWYLRGISFINQMSILLDNMPYMNVKLEDLVSLIVPQMVQYQEVKTSKKLGAASLLSTQDCRHSRNMLVSYYVYNDLMGVMTSNFDECNLSGRKCSSPLVLPQDTPKCEI